MNTPMHAICSVLFVAIAWSPIAIAKDAPPFTCAWADNKLSIYGESIPGGELNIYYIEAYCRPGSTDRVWSETTIGHKTTIISHSADKTSLQLLCTLSDGVTVKHSITCGVDEVDFRLEIHNPTQTLSQAHWAQACVWVGTFTGFEDHPDTQAYKEKCFIFLDGKQSFMPTKNWAMKARYTPGQVWCPEGVPRDDVNPRPLSNQVPSNGLIGAVSKDKTQVLATAWEPYQELFQGVIKCIHSDLRIGGLKPGETKHIRGKVYILPNDTKALLKRYEQDFPEHK